MKGGVGAGRSFAGKALLYFCGGWQAVFLCVFSIQWAVGFCGMYNFLKVMVLLKNAVYSNGICWNEKKKKLLFLEEGSPEKNELCECHCGGVD